MLKKETKWIIMDRKVIAVGVPRNRQLVMLDGKSKARVLTYNSKKLAEAGFKRQGFSTHDVWEYFQDTYAQKHQKEWDGEEDDYESLYEYLEAVPVEITIMEIEQ